MSRDDDDDDDDDDDADADADAGGGGGGGGGSHDNQDDDEEGDGNEEDNKYDESGLELHRTWRHRWHQTCLWAQQIHHQSDKQVRRQKAEPSRGEEEACSCTSPQMA